MCTSSQLAVFDGEQLFCSLTPQSSSTLIQSPRTWCLSVTTETTATHPCRFRKCSVHSSFLVHIVWNTIKCQQNPVIIVTWCLLHLSKAHSSVCRQPLITAASPRASHLLKNKPLFFFFFCHCASNWNYPSTRHMRFPALNQQSCEYRLPLNVKWVMLYSSIIRQLIHF